MIKKRCHKRRALIFIALTFFTWTFSGSLSWANSSQMIGNERDVSPIIQEELIQEKLKKLEKEIQFLKSKITQNPSKSSDEIEVGENLYGDDTTQSVTGELSKDDLEVHVRDIGALEKKILELDNRIVRLTKKPYLDPKGFKRTALKHLRDNLVHELREVTHRLVKASKSGDQPSL